MARWTMPVTAKPAISIAMDDYAARSSLPDLTSDSTAGIGGCIWRLGSSIAATYHE